MEGVAETSRKPAQPTLGELTRFSLNLHQVLQTGVTHTRIQGLTSVTLARIQGPATLVPARIIVYPTADEMARMPVEQRKIREKMRRKRERKFTNLFDRRI